MPSNTEAPPTHKTSSGQVVGSNRHAFSRIGLPNQDHAVLQTTLLEVTLSTPIARQDWQYFGKHALPLVMATWVEEAQQAMHLYHDGREDLELPRIMFAPVLCEIPTLK